MKNRLGFFWSFLVKMSSYTILSNPVRKKFMEQFTILLHVFILFSLDIFSTSIERHFISFMGNTNSLGRSKFFHVNWNSDREQRQSLSVQAVRESSGKHRKSGSKAGQNREGKEWNRHHCSENCKLHHSMNRFTERGSLDCRNIWPLGSMSLSHSNDITPKPCQDSCIYKKSFLCQVANTLSKYQCFHSIFWLNTNVWKTLHLTKLTIGLSWLWSNFWLHMFTACSYKQWGKRAARLSI